MDWSHPIAELATVAVELFSRGAWSVIPVALCIAFACRYIKRPATRHTLWMVVLVWFLAPLVLPQLPTADLLPALPLSDADPLIAATSAESPLAANDLEARDHIPAALTPEFAVISPAKNWMADAPSLADDSQVPASEDRMSDRTLPLPVPSSMKREQIGTLRRDHPAASRSRIAGAATPLAATCVESSQTESFNGPSPLFDEIRIDEAGAPCDVAMSSAALETKLLEPPITHKNPAPPPQAQYDTSWRELVMPWLAGLSRVRAAISALPSFPASIWIGGVVILLIVQVTWVFSFRRQLGRAHRAPRSIELAVAEIARKIGVRPPETRIVETNVSPMIWCGRTTKLILPWKLWTQLDRVGRQAILCHELAHLKRMDHWICRLQMLVFALYWWHPIAWWARRRLNEEADLSCDAWVTWLMPQGRKAYAQAILKTKEFMGTGAIAPPVGAIGVMSPGARSLARRLTMVMTQRSKPGVSMSGMMIALSAILIGWAAIPAQSCPPDEKDKAKAKVAQELKAVAAARGAQSADRVHSTTKSDQRGDAPSYQDYVKKSGDEATAADAEQTRAAMALLEKKLAELGAQMAEVAQKGDRDAQSRIGNEMGRLGAELGRLGASLGQLHGQRGAGGHVPNGTTPDIRVFVSDGEPSGAIVITPGPDGPGNPLGSTGPQTHSFSWSGSAPHATTPAPPAHLPRYGGNAGGAFAAPAPPPAAGQPGFMMLRADNGPQEWRKYLLPDGKREDLTALMTREDVPVLVRPVDDGIEVQATPNQHAAFKAFVDVLLNESKSEMRAYQLPQGKLEAMKKLLARDDVHVRVHLGEPNLKVEATSLEQSAIEAFIRLINPAGQNPNPIGGSAPAINQRVQALALLEAARTTESRKPAETRERVRLGERLRERMGALNERARSKANEAEQRRRALEKQAEDLERQAEQLREQIEKLESQADEQRSRAAEADAQLRAQLDSLADQIENRVDGGEAQIRQIERQSRRVNRDAERIAEQAERWSEAADAARETLDDIEVVDVTDLPNWQQVAEQISREMEESLGQASGALGSDNPRDLQRALERLQQRWERFAEESESMREARGENMEPGEENNEEEEDGDEGPDAMSMSIAPTAIAPMEVPAALSVQVALPAAPRASESPEPAPEAPAAIATPEAPAPGGMK